MNRSRTVLLVGAALLMAVAYVVQGRPAEPPAAGPVPTPAFTAAVVRTPAPSVETPDAVASRPAPSPPRSAAAGIVAVRIEIPRLGIDLPIVEGDGVNAPDAEVAHFPGTAWPGAGSNTYLYAHAREGVFLPLWDAVEGDRILLSLANGDVACYEVDRVQPAVAWNDLSVLMPTGQEQLSLQTSTSYTPTAPRFLVVALPCAFG